MSKNIVIWPRSRRGPKGSTGAGGAGATISGGVGKLLMGSSLSTNYDGIIYDDATNTFSFVADNLDDGSQTDGAKVCVGMLRITHASDASATSTAHGLEFSNGQGQKPFLKMDGNEIAWDLDDGLGYHNFVFASVVTNVRLSSSTYLNPANNQTTEVFGSGRVCTGVRSTTEGNIYAVEHSQMQIYKNNTWINVAG